MCDLMAIGGLALAGVSTALQASAQSSVAAAREQAYDAEEAKQNDINSRAQAVNDQAQARYNNFSGQQSQDASTLADYFKNPVDATTPNAPAVAKVALPTSSSNITNRDDQQQSDVAQAYSDQQADALGNLRSFGDLLANISRGQARDAGSIGQLGDESATDANELQYALADADQAGDTASTLSSLFGGLGKVGLTAGLTSKNLPFGAALPTASNVAVSGSNISPSLAGGLAFG